MPQGLKSIYIVIYGSSIKEILISATRDEWTYVLL